MIKKLRAAAIAAALALTGGSVAIASAPAAAAPTPAPAVAAVPSTRPVASAAAKPAGTRLNAAKGVTKGRPGARVATPNMVLTGCTAVAGNCFRYTERRQDITADPATSVSTGLRVENTYLARTSNNSSKLQNASHTLEELSLSDSVGGGNVVEIGLNKDPNINSGHPDETSLFIFGWFGGTPGSYNGGNGWLNSSTCASVGRCPGASMASLVGTTHTFGWSHQADGPGGVEDGWWAFMDSDWIGVYPDASWSGGYTEAGWVQTFGELALAEADNDPVENCSDIGSGDLASATLGGRATNLTYTGTTIAPSYSAGVVSDPTKWGVVSTSATAFNFGGPGYNSIGEALGAKGSCAPATPGTPGTGFQLFKEACPDNTVTTGCNNGQLFTTALALNVCTPITGAGTVETNALKNNQGSAHGYRIWRFTNCVGTSRNYTNGQGEAFTAASGWGGTNIKAITRTS